MTITLFAFVIYCFITAKYINPFSKEVFENNFDKECTECINGIFVVLVFMSHFYFEIGNMFKIDSIYKQFQIICGQCIVCSFLFYTGYGTYEGLKKDKTGYTKKLITVKFPKLLLRFDFCVLLYAITQLCLGDTFFIKTLILSLLTISNLGNSNWYISYILIIYVITWLSFSFSKNDKIALSIIIISMIIYTLLFYILYPQGPHYFFTSFIYPLGMFWSMEKEKIKKILAFNFFIIFIVAFIFYFFSYFCYSNNLLPYGFFYNGVSVLFTIVLITVTYKIQLKNKLLSILGKNVFEVYIIQHLPMIIFKPVQKLYGGFILYLILCIILTIILVIGLKFLFNKIKIF